jgi:hypothetical protein
MTIQIRGKFYKGFCLGILTEKLPSHTIIILLPFFSIAVYFVHKYDEE